MRAGGWLVIATVALAACRVDDTRYLLPDGGDAPIDAAPDDGGGPDAPPGARLEVSPATPIALLEGGSTSVAIRLTAAPMAAVVVTITPSDAGVVAVPATWTFTPDDWSDKIIAIRAVQDDDAVAVSGDVAFQSSAGTVSVPVSVADDDHLGLFVAPTSLGVLEGNTATVQVALTAQPTGPVTVAVTSSNTLALTATTTSVTFAPGEWNQLKPVNLRAELDANTASETVDLTLSSSGLAPAVVPVTVTDADVLNLAVTPSTLAGTEGGTAGDVRVHLTKQPPGDVTVTVTSSNGHATVAPGSLTFSTSTFATDQLVHVTLPVDVDQADSSEIVTVAAAGIASQQVTVTGTDPDQQMIRVLSTSINTTEGTANLPIGVHLAYAPAASTTVDVVTTGPIGADVTQLTFSAADYATDKVIRINVPQDSDLVNDEATVVLSTPDDAPAVTVAIHIADDDSQVIDAPASVTVDEGSTAQFDVTLGFQPTTSTTVTVTSSPTGVGATPATLTFTPLDWSTPKTVTVSAATDANAVGETGNVHLAIGTSPTADVIVNVHDTTVTGLTVMPSTVALNEGSTATARLTLSADPGMPGVTVTGSSSDPMAVGIMGSPSVTLNSSNWQSGAMVTLSGIEDPDADSETVIVTWTDGAALSTAATVNVTDNDVLGLALSPTSLTIPEGQSRTVNVTLTAPPSGTVNVAVSSGPANQITGGSSLVFTTSDWNVAHPVTVHSVRDDDRAEGLSMVVFNPDSGLATKTLPVTQSPDDTIWIGRFVGAPTTPFVPTTPVAWLATTLARNDTTPSLPSCLVMDRYVTVAASAGAFYAGLYNQNGTTSAPGSSIYVVPSALTATVGNNAFDLASASGCAGTGGAFVALAGVGTLPMPSFATVTTNMVQTCPGSGSGSGGPALPSNWVATGGCGTSPALIGYFVVHARNPCSCP